jgi:hypothetical protein
VVGEVLRVVRRVRVGAGGEDLRAWPRNRLEAVEEPRRAATVAEEPAVVAEHHHRVEAAGRRADLRDRELPHIFRAAAARDLERER